MAPVSTSTAPPTALSPAELSYLHTSLSLDPPIRPDTRSRTDFRNLVGELDILPSVHGSARLVQSSDGGECIVGIKAEVEKNPQESTGEARTEWVEIAVEVAGQRDDDPLTVFLSSVTSEAIASRVAGKLAIGKRWHWKLYIDILILTPPISHPATLLSLATNLALRCTRLPRLVSEPEEDPLFDDDWDNSLPLFLGSDSGDVPPISLLVSAVDSNIFFDPTREEMAVADCVLAVSIDSNGKVAGVRTLDSGSGSVGVEGTGSGGGGVRREVIKNIIKETRAVGTEVFESLEGILKIG